MNSRTTAYFGKDYRAWLEAVMDLNRLRDRWTRFSIGEATPSDYFERSKDVIYGSDSR